ncbi:MAG: MoaD/ThiS family protein [Proteobacteria bacterium]|nr:MoaD/ThiS family protein [Pseudomonadota bacterium]
MKFVFSGALLRFVQFEKEVAIDRNTLEDCLRRLMLKFPDLERALLDNQGNIRQTHQMFLNGEAIEKGVYSDASARQAFSVEDDDSVYILTAIAGG